MKNTMKKLLSLLLVAVMLSGGIIVPMQTSVASTTYKNGDTIQYGTYPKSRVSDSKSIAGLEKVDKAWKTYGRYTKAGTYLDWFQYADFVYGDTKYRAINLINYYSGYESENGYSKNTIYYFKYAPLSWKVLDASSGLIICSEIIDCRAYQDIATNNASDYSQSFIRDWLNEDFYQTAFTENQKSNIKTTNIDTEGSVFIANSTSDKLFLTSYDEANTLLNSSSRDRYGTDYSKCLGLHKMPGNYYGWGRGQSWWWLRTPYDEDETMTVYDDGAGGGSPIRSYYVDNTSIGVVPACCLAELKNDVEWDFGAIFPDGYDFDEDSYRFGNFVGKISEKYFTTMYEESVATLLYEKKYKAGNGGHCFGIAYTTAAFSNNFPNPETVYKIGDAFVATNVSDIYRDFEFEINDFYIRVDDYIKYAFVYQWSAEQYRISQDTLIDTLKDYIQDDKIGVVLIMVRYRLDENGNQVGDGGHAVLAVGISETEDGTVIYVDDSNNRDELQTITIDRNGDWFFSNPWAGADGTRKVDSDNSILKYSVDIHKPYQILKTGNKTTVREGILENAETFVEDIEKVDADKVLLSVPDSCIISANDFYKIEETIGGEVSSDTSTLYWIEDDKTVTVSDLKDENSEIALAGDNTIITANVTKNSVVTMTIDEDDIAAEIESENGKEYMVSFNTVITDEQYNNVKTCATVKGTASGDTITATQTETGLVVTGISDGTVTLSIDDEVIATQTISDAISDIEITYDKTGEDENIEVDYEQPEEPTDPEVPTEPEMPTEPDVPAEPDEPTDDTTDCSCMCHSKNSFMQFFYKIFRLFWQLFGMNRDCACGAKHFDSYFFG